MGALYLTVFRVRWRTRIYCLQNSGQAMEVIYHKLHHEKSRHTSSFSSRRNYTMVFVFLFSIFSWYVYLDTFSKYFDYSWKLFDNKSGLSNCSVSLESDRVSGLNFFYHELPQIHSTLSSIYATWITWWYTYGFSFLPLNIVLLNGFYGYLEKLS